METQYRVRMFWTATKEEVDSPYWPVVTTDKRSALVMACESGEVVYHTLETRECPDWEPASVLSKEEVNALINSGELV